MPRTAKVESNMGRFVKRLTVIMAMLIGTGAASCASAVPVAQSIEKATSALPNPVDVTTLVYVQIYNTGPEGFTMFAVWPNARVELGHVDPGTDIVFPLSVPHGTMVRAELHFDNGYKCITMGVPAFEGGTLTLHMRGPVGADFCAPLPGSRIAPRA